MNTSNYIKGLQDLIRDEEIRNYKKTHRTSQKLINELVSIQANNPNLFKLIIV